MANIKITELNAAGSLAATDVVPVVDVSTDETKKITATDLFRTLPDGTAAAPSLSFASDAGNGVFLAGTDTVGISTGGTQRVTVDGSGNVTISGDLQVDGATTTVQSTTVTIDDKNIELGSVASPSDTTADGGGITLKGATDKTLKWINSTGHWTFNTGIDISGDINISGGNKTVQTTAGFLQVGTSGSNHLAFITNGSEKARIDSSGRIQYSHNTYLTAKDSAGSGYVELLKANASNQTVIANNKNAGIVFVNTNTSELARIDSNGSFGIGTSSPDARFEVVKSSTGEVEVARFRTEGNTNNPMLRIMVDESTGEAAIRSSGSVVSKLILGSGNNDHLTIATNGRVGIGASSIDERLHVEGSGSNERIKIENTTSNIAGLVMLNTSRRYDVQVNGSALQVYDNTGSAERLRIDSSGRVGIGTSSPNSAFLLDVATGAVRSDGNGFYVSENYSTNNNVYRIYDNSSEFAIESQIYGNTTSASAPIVFRTSSSDGRQERLRIDSSGNVGIGITVDSRASLAVLARTDSNALGNCLSLQDGSTSSIAASPKIGVDANDLVFKTNSAIYNATERLRIDSTGNARFTQSIRTTASNGSTVIGEFGRSSLFITGGSQDDLGVRATGHMRFATGGNTERMRIDSSGRVGIGTTAPPRFLTNANDVTLTTGTAPQYRLNGTAGDGNDDDRAIFGLATASNHFVSGAAAGDAVLRTTNGGNLLFGEGTTERLRIDSSGNVGIGTTSPQEQLHVSGTSDFVVDTTGSTVRFGSYGEHDIALVTGRNTPSLSTRVTIENGNGEAARIDSSGRLLVGGSSSSGVGAKLQVIGDLGAQFHRGENSAGGASITLSKSRNTTYGSNTIVQDDDTVGIIAFRADDGTDYSSYAAFIGCHVDGTPGSNDMPGRLVFSTSADGASSPTERLRITSTGAWGIEGASNYGTSGQVLTSNGNDSPTWQDASGGGGATGGGSDQWVVETDQTVTTSYELTAGKHGTTVSPTINSGATVTVPSGAILVIL